MILLSAFSMGIATGQTNESDARLAIQRGNEKFAKEEYKAALKEYQRVPQSAGELYAQSRYNIGVCYYELCRTEDAIGLYKRAIEARSGRYPRAWYALGVALEDQGQVTAAKEAYRQSIITSRGDYAAAHYRLGVLAASEGDNEGAAALFEKAMAHPGEHVPASHNNLGVMLARMGRLTEAEREFEIAVRQTEGAFNDATYNLKLCHSLLAAPKTAQVAALKISETIADPMK
jgi:tetratricopeptide (TPR) repeat protein